MRIGFVMQKNEKGMPCHFEKACTAQWTDDSRGLGSR
jgi:hypothetical protein